MPGDSATPKDVSWIYVNPEERVVGMLGVTVEFAAGAYAADGSHVYGLRDDAERFSWSSSDPSVATVDGGAVRSVGVGTTTVTVAVEGVTRSVPVTVRDRARFGWSVPIPGGIHTGNVMAADGTIYVGSYDGARDTTTWYAVSPGGSVLWTLDLRRTQYQMPAIGADGTLYLGSESRDSTEVGLEVSGSLVAVDPAGTVRWVRKGLDQGILASPALAPDGTIYVVGDSRVHAVGPQGELRWTYEAGGQDVFHFSSPAVARDGTIHVGGFDGRLYAVNPDGSLKWTFQTDDRSIGNSSPAIGTDGTIYFGAQGRLYAVGPDGTERWSVGLFCPEGPDACWGLDSSPSIGADGTIYAQAKGLYAVDPDGSIRWSAPGVYGSGDAILGADGTIYVAGLAPPGRWGIHALDSEGRRLGDYPKNEARRSAMFHRRSSPILGLDGSIIVAAGNELVSIVEHHPTNGGHAASPWPQGRSDRARSGRAGG